MSTVGLEINGFWLYRFYVINNWCLNGQWYLILIVRKHDTDPECRKVSISPVPSLLCETFPLHLHFSAVLNKKRNDWERANKKHYFWYVSRTL